MTRTYGPLIKSQLLYQLSYAPAAGRVYNNARTICRERRLIFCAEIRRGRGSA